MSTTETKVAKEPTAWSVNPDVERLIHTDIGSAIEEWFDDFDGDVIPETVTVHGFAPMDLPKPERIAGQILEQVLERLDEDYSDPDGDSTVADQVMKDAALTCAKAILGAYRVWTCEKVSEEVVKVRDYISDEEIDAAIRASKRPQ